MRRLVGRGAALVWAGVYFFTLHTPAPIVALIPRFGIFGAAIAIFAASSLWGIIFYLLLRSDEDLQEVSNFINRRRKKGDVIKGRSIYWIFFAFLFLFGPVGGVLTTKLTYPEVKLRKVLLVILAGCALNTLVWVVVVAGGLFTAARHLFYRLFAG